MTDACTVCRRDLSPEQVAGGLTEHIHHATQDPAINRITSGPCALCGAGHTLYGPRGKPLCDDCDPREVTA